MMRFATFTDIPRLMEIRGSVRENRLSDPGRVTLADYNWHVAHAPIHVWEDDGVIKGLSAGDPRDGSIWENNGTNSSTAYIRPPFHTLIMRKVVTDSLGTTLVDFAPFCPYKTDPFLWLNLEGSELLPFDRR